ncbi:DUF5691 domain-containing protein [Peristeroidobacter soli]|uniref:DUF5691 domain-containing protein n=1 Tax=Peristeroidobacter soli TaxID=2497877 RepID=UPI001FE2DD90|nr:DUF5691 domain-containing protein [Peristeroidobacter soli]
MSTPPSAWDQLASLATLGTRRTSIENQSIWPEASLSSLSEATSPERTLLRAASARKLWDLAGARTAPEAVVAAAPPAPAPNTSELPEAAAMRLVRMIGGDRREFIPEWFEHARESKRILPPHFLPLVLEHVPPAVRATASSVLGPTAAWLAQLNSTWTVTPIVAEPSEQRWQEGTLEERRAELAAMRARDPARGREWVVTTWESDPPEAREAFVRALLIGLSDQDEAFLESALDDKRKAVRQAAIECLVRLPQATYAQRMRSRLEPLVAFENKSGLLGKFIKRRLIIELPTSPDKAAQRDGIDVKVPAQRKIGERAYWLVQMVELSQPVDWTARFQCDPATLIDAVMATEYAGELLDAFSESAKRHPDPAWLHALCDAWLSLKQESYLNTQAVAQLVAAAPEDQRGALIEALLGRKDHNFAFTLLASIDVPWTSSLTAKALELLSNRARDERQQWSHNRNALSQWALKCDVPTAAARLPRILETTSTESAWRNALEEFNDLVEFRAAMKREMV